MTVDENAFQALTAQVARLAAAVEAQGIQYLTIKHSIELGRTLEREDAEKRRGHRPGRRERPQRERPAHLRSVGGAQ